MPLSHFQVTSSALAAELADGFGKLENDNNNSSSTAAVHTERRCMSMLCGGRPYHRQTRRNGFWGAPMSRFKPHRGEAHTRAV